MQTFVNVGTLLVLFEKQGERKRFVETAADAGYGRNALISYPLFHDWEYVLRLRFYYERNPEKQR